jgi:hypothetical protein
MTVVATGDDGLKAWVGEGLRPLLIETLRLDAAASAEALAAATKQVDRERFEHRLELGEQLRFQLEQTVGQGLITGPEEFVVEIVRDTTNQATSDLDVLVESIASAPTPLDDETIVALRARSATAMSGIEALIACESHRRSPA